MSLIFSLALKSLRNRMLTTLLTLVSIALSIALLVGVENVRVATRESFTNTIRGTDLIVGPRSSPLQILLYSVFGMGSPLSNNMSYETYEYWTKHPDVAWTIPYSLGDSHRGFRVIGTTDDFYEHYKYRVGGSVEIAEGARAKSERDVVIGSEVAERLNYQLGSRVAVTHGLRGSGIMDHEESPFTVVGILAKTFTPIDRALYVTLEGIHAMHEGWESGAPPSSRAAMPGGAPPDAATGASGSAMPGASQPAMPGATPPSMPGATPPSMPGSSPPPVAGAGVAAGGSTPDRARSAGGADHDHPRGDSARAAADSAHDHGNEEKTQITAFFAGMKDRRLALRVQYAVNQWTGEPLTAVIPGVELQQMWESFGTAEDGLKIITFFVVAVGLLGMLVSLYSSLSARRREMAILRSVGAGPPRIVSLLVLESGILSVIGCIAGVALVYLMLVIGQPIVEQRFGLHIPIRALGKIEYIYIGVVCAAGFLIGLVPAIKAYRNALVDGLSVRL